VAVVGSPFSFYGGYITGKVLAIEKPSRIELSWHHADWAEGHMSTVTLEFEEQPGGQSCKMKLHQVNVPEEHVKKVQEGWCQYYFVPMRAMAAGMRNVWGAQGSICHVEMPTYDMERIKRFYGDVFSWTWQQWAPEYALFRSGSVGGLGGGVVLKTDQREKTETLPKETELGKSVVFYINVVDIEAVIPRIKQAGGAILKSKTLIADNVGWYAVFHDTEGNEIGLYQTW
jgi:predicted enzyme related to lactoylglutathione lyase